MALLELLGDAFQLSLDYNDCRGSILILPRVIRHTFAAGPLSAICVERTERSKVVIDIRSCPDAVRRLCDHRMYSFWREPRSANINVLFLKR